MSMPDPTGLRGESYFRALLEGMADGLEGRDTSLYRAAASDRWRQSSTPGEWSQHLEFWIDLGAPDWRGHTYAHAGRLMFSCRYRPDNDSRDQARLQAIIRDAMEYLITTPFPHNGRVQSLSPSTVFGPLGGMLEITVPFVLHLQR